MNFGRAVSWGMVPSFRLPLLRQLTLWLGWCEGPEAKGCFCLSCWSPPCHAEVHGLGTGFALQTEAAFCDDEVEPAFVISEKAERTIN